MPRCPIGHDVSRAAEILRGGGLVALPTETVYGLGTDALNTFAVARAFHVKRRPEFDPLIVHVPDPEWLPRVVSHVPEPARILGKRFWPGPLTLVLPKSDAVPDLVTAGLPTVGVRIPAHPMARDLIRQAGTPVAAPSANLFGCVSPTTAGHVAEQLAEQIDYILDGGPCEVGLESTVLSLADPRSPALLRPGGVPLEDLEAAIGPIAVPGRDAPEGTAAPSPGMMLRHYAPRTPLRVIDGEPHRVATEAVQRVGLLTLLPPADPAHFAVVEVLSSAGDLREAAARFFAALRRLDARDLDLILAIRFPDSGLGRALNDRLRRAAR